MTAAVRLPLAVHTRHAPVTRTVTPDVTPLPVAADAPGVDLGDAVRLALLDAPAPAAAALRLVEDEPAWHEIPRATDPYAAAMEDWRALGNTLAMLRDARRAADHAEALALCGDGAHQLAGVAAYLMPTRAEGGE